MNIFAQEHEKTIIYIFKTKRNRKELDEIFSPNTNWIDITNREDIKLGYKKIKINGEYIFVDPNSELIEKDEDLILEENLYEEINY